MSPDMSPDNWNRMSFEQFKKQALQIFRLAEEEISESATLFIVHNKSYIFPGNGERIKLNHYKVRGPDGSFFEFDIAFAVFDGIEYVFLLEFRIDGDSGKYYIKHYKPDSGSAPSP